MRVSFRSELDIQQTVEAHYNKFKSTIDTTPLTRRRPGRPKKNEKAEDTDDASSVVSTPRRRGRSSKALNDHADVPAYQPAGVDQSEEGDEDVEEDWESAAVAWGTIVMGGLGTGSAGVFGAEMKAR